MSRSLVAALACASLLSASGCEFLVNHPPVAAAVAVAPIAWGSCELASSRHGTCALTAGAAAVGLAAITAVALWLGGDGRTILVNEPADPTPLAPLQQDPLPPPPPAAVVASPPVAPEPVTPSAPAPADTPVTP